jgi:adenosylhomocysteine nucleosidase
MLVIVCALECEAKPIINCLGLKKTNLFDTFPVFANRDVHLIVSGTGSLKAAIATSSIITKLSSLASYNSLFLLNIGICGASKSIPLGEAVFPHTISSHTGKKKFFQELFIKHSFKEVSLMSFDIPQSNPQLINADCVDMEAYGFFQAAASFLKTSQVYCIKVVSDHCEEGFLDKKEVSNMIEKHLPVILNFYEASKEIIFKPDILSDGDRELLKKIGMRLNLTHYQDIELEKLAVSFKIRRKEELGILNPFLNLNPKNKTEVKETFLKMQNTLNAE